MMLSVGALVEWSWVGKRAFRYTSGMALLHRIAKDRSNFNYSCITREMGSTIDP